MNASWNKIDQSLYNKIVVADRIDKQIVEWKDTYNRKQRVYNIIDYIKNLISHTSAVSIFMCFFI